MVRQNDINFLKKPTNILLKMKKMYKNKFLFIKIYFNTSMKIILFIFLKKYIHVCYFL